MNKKKVIIVVIVLLVVAMGGWMVWNKTASTTRIALVNFQPFQSGAIMKANGDPFIRFDVVPMEELGKLKKYDFVLGFGMGMRASIEQREQIQHAANKGTPVYIHTPTNPDNNICNIDSVELKVIKEYINSGNKKNYQSLARYIRQNIDKKSLFVSPADTVVDTPSDVLYHLDENVWFEKVGEYEEYLKKNNLYVEGGAKIAIVGGLNDPFSGNRDNIDSLIVSFQHAGMNIYPVSSMMKRFQFLQEINPDAVLYFAHGRLAMGQGDMAVKWLQARNIPIFAPLSILQTKEEWEADPMGMFGGFMSQSVVMPELDGSIYPYVINAQEIDENGVYLFKAIPDRLKKFTQIVHHFTTLKQKPNAEKRLSIYYFKGPGQETLTAQGLETIPSIYNFLKRLKAEGYKVDNLPVTEADFARVLMTQGSVLSTYAEGAFDEFIKQGNPALIEKTEYESWIHQSVPDHIYKDVTAMYGEAPGSYMRVDKNEKAYLAVARIQFGNIALLPQPMAGLGGDAFAIVHGAKSAPPHTYIGAYLWSQYAFKADAMLHFGTHGSLEFTPQKQVALSSNDWPDILVGTLPHFYYYTIGNVGESMMAKRRSYASTISYLTPPFMESKTRSQFKALQDKISEFYKAAPANQSKASLGVKKVAVGMGIHRELRLDSLLSQPYTQEEIERIENFAEEIANEKMNGRLYTTGIPYDAEKIESSVLAMTVEPIAYSLAALDQQKGKVTAQQLKNKPFFTQHYLTPAKSLVNQVLAGRKTDSLMICSVTGISPTEIAEARKQKDRSRAIIEVERTISNIVNYKNALQQSPELEMRSLLNALSGGYLAPTSGGDAVANPGAVPTGRNLYAINAEATPSEVAWEKGVTLVNATLEQYQKQHGKYPRKVSYTFWSSEFIESEGATIAQALYMLGVEPIRDSFGRVSDLQLISSETLGRPRVDVVVQTSGQFRDLAASRLSLITRAVEMASAAGKEKFDNFVNESVVETEHQLVEQGITPKEAREWSTMRVFGGINGMYGTGIQGMVTSGDKWESEKEIAETFINNIGAIYGSDKSWGQFQAGLLKAALHNTDVVVQPRQSNTWGALSLDHVYEFMGGMNLAVRNVTGKDPDAYFADYRNRNRVKMQELKEAIGVESRTTIFNPEYIKEVMKGNASSASQITEVVTNTYGWNVMKPDAIDNEMWNKIYDVYVKDSYQLGVQDFFKKQNPAALQEITAVMMETARKGMWKASEQQLADMATLHTELVKEFGATGSGFSGSNAKLQDFIAQKVSPQSASQYKSQLQQMKSTSGSSHTTGKGIVMKKEQVAQTAETGEKNSLNGVLIVSVVLVVFVVLLIIVRKKRKK